jgi:DNA processing protein
VERSFYLLFSQFPGIGPHKFNSLIAKFGSAEKAADASFEDLSKVIGKITAEKFLNFKKGFDISGYERFLKNKKIEYVCLSDKEYPKLLKKTPNPPFLLYVKGDSSLLTSENMFAIVGTRKITSYGEETTDLFSSQLSANFIIVSGMALGVDAYAHKSCLDSGGKTIAVLGNGVDLPFPTTNERLYDEILEKGGAVISEFPPGQPPSVGSFPSRNRIIAGMSQGVLVTQGAEDSGSVITANFAIDFERPLFAVPGPINSSLSKGPNDLIRKGAKLVFSPSDILNELGLKSQSLSKRIKGENKEEQKIIDLLEVENLPFDEIGKRLKFDASKLASILSMMEIRGILKTSEGKYLLS